MEEKEIVYVDMDGTICDFEGAFHRDLAENPAIKFPQSQHRFWVNLKPIPGALEAYKKLEEKYDVYILTSPSTRNVLCYTEKAEWIREHLGFEALKKLIISKNKSLMMGKYLIDDRAVNGAENFKGELLLIHSEKFPDWNSVLEKIM